MKRKKIKIGVAKGSTIKVKAIPGPDTPFKYWMKDGTYDFKRNEEQVIPMPANDAWVVNYESISELGEDEEDDGQTPSVPFTDKVGMSLFSGGYYGFTGHGGAYWWDKIMVNDGVEGTVGPNIAVPVLILDESLPKIDSLFSVSVFEGDSTTRLYTFFVQDKWFDTTYTSNPVKPAQHNPVVFSGKRLVVGKRTNFHDFGWRWNHALEYWLSHSLGHENAAGYEWYLGNSDAHQGKNMVFKDAYVATIKDEMNGNTNMTESSPLVSTGIGAKTYRFELEYRDGTKEYFKNTFSMDPSTAKNIAIASFMHDDYYITK